MRRSTIPTQPSPSSTQAHASQLVVRDLEWIGPMADVLDVAPSVDASYLRSADGVVEFVGLGVADRWVGAADGRGSPGGLSELDRWRQNVVARHTEHLDGRRLPVAVGGRFDPAGSPSDEWAAFPAVEGVLAQLTLVREGARVSAIWVGSEPDSSTPLGSLALDLFAGRQMTSPVGRGVREPIVGPESPESRVAEFDHYCTLVQRALGALGPELRKLVPARSRRVPAGVGAGVLGKRLVEAARGASTVFVWRRGGRCFAGATPERLLRRSSGRFSTFALAGTRPRGFDTDTDERLARDLAGSDKEASEHRLVVEGIVGALENHGLCEPEVSGPEIMRLPHVQHLRTLIECDPDPTCAVSPSLLEVASSLHPTPAVAGSPPAPARAWLASNEGMDRGWYAGPIGWVDGAGDGELWVALRSALVSGREAIVFAGAGVVPGSDPSAEWSETEAKLGPMVEVLHEREPLPIP